ncbi:hypothetical protein [Ensifer sp. ENS01]|uniref:hypothetical protein n=1 Tax=Ensifer sp. ENS01 TaxID=2769293 RepID=UPI00178770DF|nr:hypothetical protein [Ensifer sp. ENS01]MBD9498892.1 hypothetical protein [Ensifer sp. ENS01]
MNKFQQFKMGRRYVMGTMTYGEDYVDLANPARQSAPPVLSSRAAMTTPFPMPKPRDHQIASGDVLAEEGAPASGHGLDDFDQFGGWLV